MVHKSCEICGKDFRVVPCRAETSRYCSLKCCGLSQRNRIHVACKHCGKHFETVPNQVRRGRGKFCSHKCFEAWHRGINNGRHKGGCINQGGYRVLCIDGRKNLLEHRVVAENCLGRPLEPEEIVHHINGDILDNSPGNLLVFASQSDHRKFHANTFEGEYITLDDTAEYISHDEPVLTVDEHGPATLIRLEVLK